MVQSNTEPLVAINSSCMRMRSEKSGLRMSQDTESYSTTDLTCNTYPNNTHSLIIHIFNLGLRVIWGFL